MRSFFAVLRSPWTISLVGLLLVDLIIWLVGPLISVGGTAVLEGLLVRLLVCLLLPLLLACAYLLAHHRGRVASRALAGEIASSKPSAAGRTEKELDELTHRMRDSLDRLKKIGGGKRGQYLYQIPWYIIIGPPGSGKTTLLKNSGLQFPVDIADSVKGVGGTRNCDWWFSEQAVLLDTAGRYTTQDSDGEVDRDEWLGFLGILKKHRRRQPVNGLMVAISMADLLRFDATERQAHALAIRKRIADVNERLGLRLPVYVLFTKLDLLAGFVEFFDDLGKEEREQVWGMSFDYDDGHGAESLREFPAAFDALASRLGERIVERIHAETDVSRRSGILGFPQQFAVIKTVAGEFLESIFRGNRYENRALLRGVYFTSATQFGNPIDRLMGTMASVFGLRPSAQPAFNGRGRSYFITRLLLNVVFNEAGLVGADPKVVLRQRRLRIGTEIAAAAIAVIAIAAFTTSYFGNIALIDRVDAAAVTYRDAVNSTDPARMSWPDLARLLDQARDLPTGSGHAGDSPPLSLTFGLYQGDKLGSKTADVYHRALEYLLLPKLIGRLDGQLRRNLDQPDLLFSGLEVYLMLGKRVERHKEPITHWFSLDFAAQFPAADQEPLRQALARHVAALADADLVDLPIDTGLIEQVRAALRQVTPAQRVLARIRQSGKAADVPAWSVLTKAGPASNQVFHRLSGKPLSEGVPGLFTRDGFYRAFLPQLPTAAKEVLDETALVDKPRDGGALDAAQQIRVLSDETLTLYSEAYTRQWESILGDVVIVPLGNAEHAAEILNILGGASSPLRQLIQSIVEETTLTQLPADLKALEEAKAAAAGQAVNLEHDQRLSQLLRPALAAAAPGQKVEDNFRRLRAMTQGSPSQLDSVIDNLAKLYRQTIKLNDFGGQGNALLAAGGGSDGNVAQALVSEAALMPPPFNTLLGGVAKSSSALAADGARAQLNGLWRANVLPFCQQALGNRYPFVRGSTMDVTLDDFSRLFSPNGLIVQFYSANLARFVDASHRPWRWQKGDNAELGLSAEALEQFERAMAIGDSFFHGGNSPQVSFEMVPVSLDAAATEVSLEINGQRLAYSHGPIVPQRMQWPGTSSQTTVNFLPPVSGNASGIVKDGPWSFFRLLEDGATGASAASERFTATFSVSGHNASFEIRAGSVNNPFDLNMLRRFRCPSSL